MGASRSSETKDGLDPAVVLRDRIETLGRLTAGIAHELNNPIGYIASNLHTLERYAGVVMTLIDGTEADLPEAVRAAWRSRLTAARWDYVRSDLPTLITETRQGAEQLKHVVAELKGLCHQAAKPELVTVDACVHAALLVLTHALKRRTRICLDLAAPLPLSLVRAQVVQLLINLVHNAIEAFGDRPRATNTIRITSRGEGENVLLWVEDNGPGIPPAQRARLFETFRTTKRKGTGLGLVISARIARDHGGSLGCDASPDLEGARFTVTLSDWLLVDRPST